MANLVVLTDLSAFPITRQELYDAWANAQISSIIASDLADGFLSNTLVSTYSDAPANPSPGQMMWVLDEQLSYVYHDEVGGTGVSLWLAVGPDTFETACLLGEDCAAGAAVEPMFDKWVRPALAGSPYLADGVDYKPIGVVHSGVPWPLHHRAPDTQASGTWVRVGIDGFVNGWTPNSSGDSESWYASNGNRYLHLSDLVAGGLFETAPSAGKPPVDGYIARSLYSIFENSTPTEAEGRTVRALWMGYRKVTGV